MASEVVLFSMTLNQYLVYQIRKLRGHPGGSVGQVSDFGSGNDLTVAELEARVGLHTGRAEPAGGCLSSLFASLSLESSSWVLPVLESPSWAPGTVLPALRTVIHVLISFNIYFRERA